MSIRTHTVYAVLTILTFSIVIVSILQPALVSEFELLIAGLLIALVGIPHGATDYIIFKSLVKNHFSTKKQNVTFFTYYTFLLLGYALVWVYLPIVAFIIFMFLSIYHFGQSNLNYIKTKYPVIRVASYLMWGSFVILVPVSIHIDSAMAIIENMTAFSGELPMSRIMIAGLPRDLFVINFWLMTFLFFSNMISKQDFFREIITLSVLTIAFYNTPLLIGFTIYFAVWHSFGSILDQIQFIKNYRSSSYSFIQYYKDAAPMIVLSFVGIALVGYMNYIGWLEFSIVGLFFILISIVTLPHMLLIERLYDRLVDKTMLNRSIKVVNVAA